MFVFLKPSLFCGNQLCGSQIATKSVGLDPVLNQVSRNVLGTRLQRNCHQENTQGERLEFQRENEEITHCELISAKFLSLYLFNKQISS